MKRRFALSLILLAGIFATTFTSCKKDDDDDDEKTATETFRASFTFEGNHRPTPGYVQFTNTSTLATSYSWDFGDNSEVSTEASPKHKYEAAGTYKVVLTATSSDGSTKTSERDITMLGACTKVDLEDFFIYKEAVTDGDGTEWDEGTSGVDLTFKIFNSNNEEVFDLARYASDYVFDDSVNTAVVFSSEDVNLPALPCHLNSITETYKIVVYDYDEGVGFEQICEATFKMEDFIPTGEFDPYPGMFEIETPHIAVNISWTE